MSDPYSVLGVPSGASPDECKKAYRKLAKQFHPDVNQGDATAAERFKEISAAYEQITNPKPEPQPNFDFGFGRPDFGFGFSGRSPFEDLFTHMTGGHRRDFSLDVRITLEEAYSGKETTLQAPNGDGTQRDIKIKIPAGIEDGTRLIIPQGGPKLQNRPSDLYIFIRILPHDRFVRHGLDILQTVPVSVFDILLGKDIEITGINGHVMRVSIPDNWDSTRKLRLAGQGMTNNQFRGDLLVDLYVQYPPLTDEQRKALSQIVGG